MTDQRASNSLPTGLQETIDAFKHGCDSKNHQVAEDVSDRIIQRFSKAFEAASTEWPKAKEQVLTLARLAGRSATLYADLDRSFTVQWVHARFALRDAQAECKVMRDATSEKFGKHCAGVDLDTP